MLYTISDLIATLLENTLIVSAIACGAGFRFTGYKQAMAMTSCVILLSLFVAFANNLVYFSFLTIVIAFLTCLLLSPIFSKGSILLRALSCTLIIFFLHMLDYIIGFSLAFLLQKSDSLYESFQALATPGSFRLLYTLVNKSIQTILSLILFRYIKNIRTLSLKMQIILFISFIFAYSLMSICVNIIISSPDNFHSSFVILAWILLATCMIAFIFIVVLYQSYSRNQQALQKQLAHNLLLSKEYKATVANEKELAKKAHDFTKHLEALSQLPVGSEASEYIHELLQNSSSKKTMHDYHTGNEILDAILSLKHQEADTQGICFEADVILTTPLQIASLDLCSILSNLLDNAIEACLRSVEKEKRFVNMYIRQKHNILYCEVNNYCETSPIITGKKLIRKKSSPGHGFGTQIIRDIVKKYDGNIQVSYSENCFHVEFTLMNRPM